MENVFYGPFINYSVNSSLFEPIKNTKKNLRTNLGNIMDAQTPKTTIQISQPQLSLVSQLQDPFTSGMAASDEILSYVYTWQHPE